MSGNVANYIALLAALVVAYGIFSSDTDSAGETPVVPTLQGYYLRDAVITETTASGAPHFRVAAFEVKQNPNDNSVALTGLRVDYLKPADAAADAAAAHWVLNADRGTAFENFRKLSLESNVQAHNLGAPHAIVLDTDSLDVDMNRQTARSQAPVDIDIDADNVSGRGLFVDMNREHLKLESDVGFRLAQTGRSTPKPSEISLPDTFDADSFDYKDNVWTLVKVRSKTPPHIEADNLRATGADLANNQIVLRGNVKLELPKQGQLAADTAVISIRNNQVASAHVTADSPDKLIEFQHRRKDSEQWVRGRASVIDYDVVQGMLRLNGNGWFSDEQGEWNVDRLEYNIATEAVHGTRNTIKINPRSKNVPPAAADVGKDQSP